MRTWSGSGLAVAARRFGENDAVLDLFTADQGRLAGLVYGGAGSRKRALLEPGTRLSAGWTARAEDALGWFERLEAQGPGPAALLDDPAGLSALQHVSVLLHTVLPERQAFPALWEATLVLLDALAGGQEWPAVLVRWEAGLLAETGYGLDLEACALTGVQENLAFVSPRSGRAASAQAGAPFADRLLRLPPFLATPGAAVEAGDVADGLALTGHFLATRVLAPQRQDLPGARDRLIVQLGRAGRL
jgi:DNA repair protein RecO (recombination protein O)